MGLEPTTADYKSDALTHCTTPPPQRTLHGFISTLWCLFAPECFLTITEAIANMDDDGIMLEIYDNIGDELKAKNKLLEKEKQKVKEKWMKMLNVVNERGVTECLWRFEICMQLLFTFKHVDFRSEKTHLHIHLYSIGPMYLWNNALVEYIDSSTWSYSLVFIYRSHQK